MLLFELEDAHAFLPVGFGFGGAVGVDAAFGEVVGAAAGDDERGPAVAMLVLVVGVAGALRLGRAGQRRLGRWSRVRRAVVASFFGRVAARRCVVWCIVGRGALSAELGL
tara:strand:+ start:11480 stop:11809 length:330 start_codon:yes stop_codon:yes gene_type:complete